MDTVLIMTILLLAVSAGIFYWFFRFTIKLVRQHYDIYPLLYDLEEAEKKKRDGESN